MIPSSGLCCNKTACMSVPNVQQDSPARVSLLFLDLRRRRNDPGSTLTGPRGTVKRTFHSRGKEEFPC